MASALLVVASLLLGLGPTAVGLMTLLLRYPQLLLVALTSAGAYYTMPIVVTAVWYAVIGGPRYASAQGFFVAWMAVVVELGRLYMCKWVLRAEAEFQSHDQTIVATKSSPLLAKMPLGAAVGLGVSAVHVAITLGVVANAEVAMTWVDHGSATGEWMPDSVDNMVWIDVSGCPGLPKIANVALQALLFSGLHVIWSIWMMYGVDAAFAMSTKTPSTHAVARSAAAAVNAEERTPLANESSRADEAELTTTSVLHRAAASVPAAASGGEAVSAFDGRILRRGHGLLLIAGVFSSHTLLRLVSLAGGDAMEWDGVSLSWQSHSQTRGCTVVLPVQATLLLSSVVASMVMWKRFVSDGWVRVL